jgi:acetylornithine/succinyldiaminopimelate/putrescine aminotransferase
MVNVPFSAPFSVLRANTFGGNPLACEAALMTIKLLEKKYGLKEEKGRRKGDILLFS